jgi:predicted Zn-dependent protease
MGEDVFLPGAAVIVLHSGGKAMGIEEDINQFRQETGITDDVLRECARIAFNYLDVGRPIEAEVVAKGLVAADRRNAYYRTLLGTALLRKGQRKDALEVVNKGLEYNPGDRDLEALRAVLAPAG